MELLFLYFFSCLFLCFFFFYLKFRFSVPVAPFGKFILGGSRWTWRKTHHFYFEQTVFLSFFMVVYFFLFNLKFKFSVTVDCPIWKIYPSRTRMNLGRSNSSFIFWPLNWNSFSFFFPCLFIFYFYLKFKLSVAVDAPFGRFIWVSRWIWGGKISRSYNKLYLIVLISAEQAFSSSCYDLILSTRLALSYLVIVIKIGLVWPIRPGIGCLVGLVVS